MGENLRCPSCGGEHAEDFIPLPDRYPEFEAVVCRDCGMRGPKSVWNTRAPGPLVWTATPPTEPGWYWVKHPNLPLEISEFSADEIEHWQSWYWQGYVWAGPIPEPRAAADRYMEFQARQKQAPPGPAVARLLAAAKEVEGTFVELYGPREEMPDDCEAAQALDLLRDGIAGLEAAGGTG